MKVETNVYNNKDSSVDENHITGLTEVGNISLLNEEYDYKLMYEQLKSDVLLFLTSADRISEDLAAVFLTCDKLTFISAIDSYQQKIHNLRDNYFHK